MPYYSDDLVEEVRSRNDIVDVIGSYVKLQRKGANYFGLCPFHSEKSPSFSVSPSKQMYHCFGCGAGGNVFTFLMQYENFTFPEAIGNLAQKAGVELPVQEMTAEQKKEADQKSRLLEVNKEAAKYFYALLRSPRGRRAYDYFSDRKLDPQTMQKFGLGYSDQYSDDLYRYLRGKGYPDSLLKDSGLIFLDERKGGRDKFFNRAMFPIMDARGRVIAFGGRVMGEGEPKYLNSPETPIFDKSRNLYGLNFARNTRNDWMLLCEGYMDVIALHQAGFTNAVASLGTSLTAGHAGLLKRFTSEVLLTYDSDGAGLKAALRAIPILKDAGITAKIVNMEPYKDPDEFIKNLGRQAYQDRIDKAENSFLFRVRMAQKDYDLKDPGEKTAFFRKIASMLLEFPQELERNNYIQTIAGKYMIRPEDLRKMVNSLAMKGETETRTVRSDTDRKQKEYQKSLRINRSQKLLLTWFVENPGLIDRLSGLIGPEDFSDGLYRQAAEMIYDTHHRGQEIVCGRMIDAFPDEAAQREISMLFSASLPETEQESDREKALFDVVIRVKQDAIQEKTARLNPSDLNGMMDLIRDKKKLEELQKSGRID